MYVMKNTYKLSVILILLLMVTPFYAQVGFGTSTPNKSSVIDLFSSSKGLLYPRVNLPTLTGSSLNTYGLTGAGATDGMMVYNTSATSPFSKGLYSWYNSKWNLFSTDLRLVGTRNHITQDAGVGSNGTGVGTGTDNIAIGEGVMNANTNGNQNIAMGTNALGSSTTGNDNTALGHNSLTSSNGASASNNTVVGSKSLFNNTSGSNNTAIGYNTLVSNTTGSNNIAIGSGVNLAGAAKSNSMNIGNAIFGTGMTGTLATPAGNIGIGTTSPSSKLEVNGSATNKVAFDAAATSSIDYSKSNLAYTSASAGVFTLSNMKDGGTYTLSVKGATSGTSTFTHTSPSTITFKYVNNGPTTASKHTLYTFIVMGTDAYVYMTTGF